MKKIILLFLILPATQSLTAQNRLSVSAPDSLAFILFVNEAKINNVLCTGITLESIPIGKTSVKMICGKEVITEVNQVLSLKDFSQTSFELRKIKGEYKLAMVSEISIVSKVPVNSSMQIDSTAKTTGLEYSGNKGCDRAADEIEFNQLKSGLSATPFEFQKLERMKAFINENCLRVQQLHVLLSILELEENKLKLFEAALGHIYDVDHLKKTEDIFLLEKNKQKVREMAPQ